MALWGKTDAELALPKYLTDEQRKHCIFVDATEAADPDTKKKGITGPGWYLYKSRKDSSGKIRHYAECLIPMRVTAVAAGDRINDTGIEAVEAYVLSFTTDPVNSSVAAPDTASFSVVAAISAGGGTISYQWQEAPAANKNFVSLTDTGVYSGTTTNTLAISDSTDLNKKKYRCVITATGAVAVTSKYATLTVTA